MTPEQSVAATAVHIWKQYVERAGQFFSGLSDQQLLAEVAPGKNRLVYLWGHLIAVNDHMLPILGIGPRLHAELDAAFLAGADKTVDELPSAAELARLWNEVHGTLLEGFNSFTAADWAKKHTLASDQDFAANPLRNRLGVLLSRTAHVAYHHGQAVLAPR